MRIVISEKQFKKIVLKSIGNQELSEEGEEGGAPESGASSDGEKKTGATKWESGVTRGPANQIGNTKWSDIVGSQLKRGKANPLAEQDIPSAPTPVYGGSLKDRTGIEVKIGSPRKNQVPSNKTKNASLVFEEKYKTFWGETYTIPVNRTDSDYTVKLWDASTSRVNSFGADEQGNWVVKKKFKDNTTKEFKYAPPPEGYLRKLFPDGTIKSIKDEKTGKYYGIVMTLADLNANWNKNIKKDGSLMAGALSLEKPVAEQWVPKHYAYVYYPNFEYMLGKEEAFMNIKQASVPKEYTDFVNREYTDENDFQRYINRRSYNGLEVPVGFDPNKYDEYLSKRKMIDEKIKGIGKVILRKFGETPSFTLDDEGKKKREEYNKFQQEIFSLRKQYDDLYKKYASPIGPGGPPEFSYGTDERTREAYFRFKAEIEKEYNQKIKDAEVLRDKYFSEDGIVNYDMDGTPIYSERYWGQYTVVNKLIDEKNLKLKDLNSRFGYDYEKPSILGYSFDKFWDNWGGTVSFAGNFLLILFSGGIAGAVRGTALAAYRGLIVPTADAAFNAMIASYELNRGKNVEAAFSIICTFVPFAKYFGNIGKIDKDAALNLAIKVRNAGPNLFIDPRKLQKFIFLLSDEEKYIFRNVSSLSKEQLNTATEKILKDFEKGVDELNLRSGTNFRVPASKKAWVKPLLKELGIEFVLPTSLDILNSIFKWIENERPNLPYSDEELMQLRKDIEKNIDILKDMDNFDMFINSIELLKDLKKGGVEVTKMASNLSDAAGWETREPTKDDINKWKSDKTDTIYLKFLKQYSENPTNRLGDFKLRDDNTNQPEKPSTQNPNDGTKQ